MERKEWFMLVTMKEILDRASTENYGVAAPNIFSELDCRAFIEAAEAVNAPLILDIAFLIEDKYCLGYIARELARESSVPIAINLDHGQNMKHVFEAIQAGFTSVMIDCSTAPYEEAIATVKRTVEACHAVGISVESEIGHVGEAENYDVDRDAALTTPEIAFDFVEKTGVDCLAIAIGTAHGIYPKGVEPRIDFDRLAAIKRATNNLPLVLHGSSGTSDDDLRKVCSMGINKLNIAGELLQAEIEAVKSYDFTGNKAYEIYNVMHNALKEKLIEKIYVYGSANKAWVVRPLGIGCASAKVEAH